MRSVLVLLFVVANASFAQEPARTHSITVDDYFTLAAVTQIAVSPDGKTVAYTEGRWDKADDARKTDLWIVGTGEKPAAKRLTFDRANDRNAKWAADGKTIYFLGNRRREGEKKPPYDGSTQIWRLNIDGGDPTAVTRIPDGVSGYDLADGGNQLFYSVDKTHNDEGEFAKLRSKFKADYGHGIRKVSEIHRLDTRTWRTEKVVDETRYVREFAVTKDGTKIAMVSAFDDTVVKSEGESRVDMWEAGKVTTPPTDAYRAKAASPHAWLENLVWSPDGKRFAFCAVFDAYPAEAIVVERSANAWTTRAVARGEALQLRGYGSPLYWSRDNDLMGLLERKGRVLAAGLLLGGQSLGESTSEIALPPLVHSGYDSVKSGGKLHEVALASTPDRFPEVALYSGNPETPFRAITAVNGATATWKIPTVQHITWKAADGTEVGGVLELPPDYKKGDKLPLVVGIHGGPTTSTKADLNFDPHNGRLYFAVNGYAVLFPNYRGSTGYGDKFVTDLIGRENDIEVNDIVAGVQHLVKEGIADGDRVGVMGWSNGGYLTNCLITRKDLPFKLRAASSGAGIVDTVAEWGFNDEPAYPKVFKKGHPWESPELYRKSSPTYDLGNVSTPTLIHVGGNDVRCPPGHSRMLYRALKEYRKVPTELVEYPGEPHGLTKMTNRRAKMEWDLAWFEKYLKNAK